MHVIAKKKMDKSKGIMIGNPNNNACGRQSIETNAHNQLRILLCDSIPERCEEVSTLLLRFSYEVTCSRTARELIDVLNRDDPGIDIILAEANLLAANEAKLLKYILHDREMHHIPVVVVSSPDEISIIVKCLRFGATDYLLMPLSDNELLNLWMYKQQAIHTNAVCVAVGPTGRNGENGV